MDKEISIVKVDKRPHRVIARENWGLTDEQMKGMHVHHRIPRSEGGTNDPSNLYVCSPSFHAYVWHDRYYFATHATKNGHDNVILKRGIYSEEFMNSQRKKDICKKQGEKIVNNKVGILDPVYLSSPKKREDSAEAGRKGGRSNVNNRTGILSPDYLSSSRRKEILRKNGLNNGVTNMAKTNSQVWESTVDGFKGSPGNVAHHNKANGWDPGARVRIK
jgi:hypothetical protein